MFNPGARKGLVVSVLAALPLEKRPSIHCAGGWVGLKAGLDGSGKSRFHRGLNPGLSSL